MESSDQNVNDNKLQEAMTMLEIAKREDLAHNYYAAFHLYIIAMQKFNTYMRGFSDQTRVQNLKTALVPFNNRLNDGPLIAHARVNLQVLPRQPQQRQVSANNAFEAVRLAANVVKADLEERRHRNR